MPAARFVVLIGPPGSGKTYIGHLLAGELGWDHTDVERTLLERYGSREALLEVKEQALDEMERDYRERAARSPVPVVIESTGVSDQPILDRLVRDHEVRFVRVWAEADVCVARVSARAVGGNLTNDLGFTREFHALWEREVDERYDYDVRIHHGHTDAEIVSLVRQSCG